jgi:hypothetical protein
LRSSHSASAGKLPAIFNAGYAYIAEGSVYFDLKKYVQDHRYGQLVDIDFSTAKTNAEGRINTDEYEKENIKSKEM